MRPCTPPRLQSFSYVGLHRYFLTLCTERRRRVFDSADTVLAVERRLVESTDKEGFCAYAYCFMPDHLHILLVALRDDSSFVPFVRRFKQTSSYDFSRSAIGRLWQAGYHDRVLRNDEATMAVARYILMNPVRAGLTPTFQEYPFSGSQQFTLEELADCWDLRT